jgi:hypothetical protein
VRAIGQCECVAEDQGNVVDWRHIQRLICENHVDQAISEVSDQQVAEAWTRYRNRTDGEEIENPWDDPDWWANELWESDEWWAEEDRVRGGILLLIDLADTDEELERVGIAHMELDFFSRDDSSVAVGRGAGGGVREVSSFAGEPVLVGFRARRGRGARRARRRDSLAASAAARRADTPHRELDRRLGARQLA